ncbi:hypothetical protein CLOP_g18954 [Closterium sp. NIES-67]|nr:hypothetical protein CLOP_g18954 [Closterium sp. NIES-67]
MGKAKVESDGPPSAHPASSDHRVLASVSRASAPTAPSSRSARHSSSGGDGETPGGGAAVQSACGASGGSGGRGGRGTGGGLMADDGVESANRREGGGAAGVAGSAPISRRRMRLRQGEAMRRRSSDTWGSVLGGLTAWWPGRARLGGTRRGAFSRNIAGTAGTSSSSGRLQGNRRQAKAAKGLPLSLWLFLTTAIVLAVVAGSVKLMHGDDAPPARPLAARSLFHLLPDARAARGAGAARAVGGGGGDGRRVADDAVGGGSLDGALVAGVATGVEGGGGDGGGEGGGSEGMAAVEHEGVLVGGGAGDGGDGMGGDAGWEDDEEEGGEGGEGGGSGAGVAADTGADGEARDEADGDPKEGASESEGEGEGESEGEGEGESEGEAAAVRGLGRWAGPFDAIQDEAVLKHGLTAYGVRTPSSSAAAAAPRQCRQAGVFRAAVAGRSVLIVLHEASLTGAPLAGMELAEEVALCVGAGRDSAARRAGQGGAAQQVRGRGVGGGRAGGRVARGGKGRKGQRAQQRQQRVEQQRLRRRQRRQQLQQRQAAAAQKAGVVRGRAGVHVLLLNRKGGLLPELHRRGLNVLKSKGSDSWRAAMAAHVVIASSATAASWIGAYLATCSVDSAANSTGGEGAVAAAGTDATMTTASTLPVPGEAPGLNVCGQRLVWWLMENRREYFDQAKPLLPRVSTLIFISHSQAATWRAWAAAESIQLPGKQHVIPLSINAELAVIAGLAPLLPPPPLPLPTDATTAAAAAGEGLEAAGMGDGAGTAGSAGLAAASAAARAEMRRRVRARIGARGGDMVVLCLSSVNPGKGQLGLLQAALQVWASKGEVGMAGARHAGDTQGEQLGLKEGGEVGGERASGEAVGAAGAGRRRVLQNEAGIGSVGEAGAAAGAVPMAGQGRQGQGLAFSHPRSQQQQQQQRWRQRRLIVVVGAMNGKSNKGEYIVRMAEAVRERMGDAHVAAQVRAGGIVWVNGTLKVAPLYAAADTYVMNAQGIGETFGRVTVEAMAFQLPVLGTAVGGTAEIVGHNVSGLLHPVRFKGVPLLARHLALLLRRPSLRREMGARGREEVRQRFLAQLMFAHMGTVIGDALRAADASQQVG